MDTLTDLVALTLLPIWRWRQVAEQLHHGESPHDILVDQCATLRRKRNLAPDALRDSASLKTRAARAIERGRRAGLEALPWNDADYPPLLAAIIDPPAVLWVRGARAVLCQPAVAVVGSRAGSPYALAAAASLSSDLAARGVVVVSGLARGVDSAAHRGALSGGGRTVAVLGCGADIVYPREHEALAQEIAGDGAIVSEFVPGTPPLPQFFPQRNRIISGLVRAVVVIEAGEKSGSLITARSALDQGRDVLAVPGNILNGRNRGGHALLRDGAKIVETADDILEELGLGGAGSREPAGHDAASKAADATASSRNADPVLASLIPGESSDLDEIALRSGLPAARLLTRLFELELQGLVRREGGGRFVAV